MSLARGVRLGAYEILAPLGSGGMAEVYRAHDEVLGRDVAIKILLPQSQQDTGAIERFFREARAASALNHPNIVTIFEAGRAESGHFMVMELVRGRTLRALMGSPMAPEVLRDVGAQIARALATTHEAGIVHRDIKPENIMVRDDGYVKVLDFGLARLEPRVAVDDKTEPAGTITQRIVGTPRYISPERARGAAGGPATDLFSLGVVLYELVAGRHPFHAGSPYEVVLSILGDQPVPPSRWNVEVPHDLDALVIEMLEKDPARRPTAGDVARALVAPFRPGVRRAAEKIVAGGHTVGRERERAALRAASEHVAGGHGLVISVAGEPGIGKSTLIEDFIEESQHAGAACHVARGRCSERLAGTEAYLPLLDALENLLRSPEHGSSLARLLKTVAPLWHAQISPSTTDVGLKGEPKAAAAIRSQERLKRELVAFMEEAARGRPLLLFLDDVHWADVSTIDLLSYVASRFGAIPLLLIVTYRPEELLRDSHPFLRVKQDLQARGCCRELRLEFLTTDDVTAYLDVEFPGHRFPPGFATLIHGKTEGNPLFMVDVLRYLRENGALAKTQGRWMLSQALPDIARTLPESVRNMIERKIDGLVPTDRQLLLTASVQGYEFDGAVVARLLRLEPAVVEERLERLDAIHGFVRPLREIEYPDRTLTLRYRFVHVLYQNLLYGTLTPARRVALSKAVGDALEGHYRHKTADIAAELALLFEAAREFSHAVDYFRLASQKAADVFAYEEAFLLGRRALEALHALPDGPERGRRELAILVSTGLPAIANRGYSSLDVQQIYDRASTLCLELGESEQLASVLWGLYAFNIVRLQLENAQDASDRFTELARRSRDPSIVAQASIIAGNIHYYRGEFDAAEQLQQMAVRDDVNLRRSVLRLFGHDPAVHPYAYLAWSRWCLGYPDRSQRDAEVAVQSSEEFKHPYTQAFALHFAGVVQCWCGNWEQLKVYNERALAVAREAGLSYFVAASTCLDGLWLARQGQLREGVARMQEGLDSLRAIEGRATSRRFASEFSQQLARAGRLDEALRIVDEEIGATVSGHFWHAELFRVRGELLLMCSPAESAEAERVLQHAVEVSRQQCAKSLELRAATSLARLWHAQGKSQKAASVLSEIYGWFTEGFETADLKTARALLAATRLDAP